MGLGLEHFGGVFSEIRMDNHKRAVSRVLRGRTCEESDRFIAFRSHYLFDQAVAGALAAGAIDGRAVAVLVRRAREGHRPLVALDVGGLDVYQRPQPQVDAYDELLEGAGS